MTFKNLFERSHLIAAHRGNRSICPENTLSAFEASIGRCDFVELDVGFSLDGVSVVIHDDTLERTSNAREVKGFAPPYSVMDYNYAKLSELNFSSWFAKSDPFDTISSGVIDKLEAEKLPQQKIPTLYEALTLLKDFQLPVNVEIKDMSNTKFDGNAVKKIIDLIKSLHMEDMILLSSFNHKYLKEARQLAPEIMRAALQEEFHPENIISYLKRLDVRCYHPDAKIVTKELVKELKEADIIVNVFTVNNPKEKEKMFEYGVKSIFTDFL